MSDFARMIQQARFTPVRLREGYDMGEVDDFLDRVVLETASEGGGDVRGVVSGVTFTRVRMREGYDMDEVDAFLRTVLDVAEGRAPVPPAEPPRRGLVARLLGRD